MTFFWLALASCVSWFLSTLAGGGSPLILIPTLGLFLSPAAIPPVVTIGMLFGNAQRVYLYWREIDWQVTKWYLPGSIVGACLGAFTLTKIQLDWLPILLGVFLLLSAVSYGFSGKKSTFAVRTWYFLPASVIYAFLSGLVGSTGPILNPLYLNYGLVKEPMIATKSANVVVVHIAKLIAYTVFGALSLSYLKYGLLIGIAAFPGNWLGQIVLTQLSEAQFRQIVILFVAFSGLLILGKQLV